MSQAHLVSEWYEALRKGDLTSVLGALSPEVEWYEAEGNPYQANSRPWIGPDGVRDNLFVRLGADWDDFAVEIERFHDAGETVIFEGRYRGRFESTGRRLDCQFFHVWTISDEKLVMFRQYTDTAQLRAVMGRPVSVLDELSLVF